jgi:hypothetical protein
LRWEFLLRGEDQTATIKLWLPFVEEFKSKAFINSLRSTVSSITSDDELFQEKNITLAVVLLYLSIAKDQQQSS